MHVAGQVIEHGHSSPLHDSVRSQLDGLKRAELHVGHLLVESIEQCPLGACGTQGTVEEEFDGAHTTPGSPPASQNQSSSSMFPPGSDCWGRAPVTPHSPAHSKISLRDITYDVIYDIMSHKTPVPDSFFPECSGLPGRRDGIMA